MSLPPITLLTVAGRNIITVRSEHSFVQSRQFWRYPKAGVWCKSGLHHLRGVPKIVIPLQGVRQMDIIKGVFVLQTPSVIRLSRYRLQVRTSFPTPVIYRSGTKIVRTNKFQNIAKKLCFYLVNYSENAIFAMS